MKYNKLENTDLELSQIGLGTMTYGSQNSESDAHEQLDYAISEGVNFIDTAELYAVPTNADIHGLTEKYIGSWLNKSGKRDKVIIGTKIIGASEGLGFIRENPSFSDVHLQEAVDKSLQRLQTDYIDIYQLHWPLRNTNTFGQRAYVYQPDDPWEEDFVQVLESLSKLIKSGKICHWGVSNETPWGLMKYMKVADELGIPRPVTIQNSYNLLNRTFEYGNAEICMREDIPLLAYSPMAFGWLSGKYHKKLDAKESRINMFEGKVSRYSSQNSFKAIEGYIAIAEKYGLSPAQMALQFVNTQPFCGSTIIGATKIDQLKANIESTKINLSPDCLEDINKLQELITNPAP